MYSYSDYQEAIAKKMFFALQLKPFLEDLD